MLPERMMTQTPDRIIVITPGMDDIQYARFLAETAVQAAKDRMPKISGALAHTLSPVYGPNFWGIYFPDKKVWYLERGTRPFTMNNLAGKLIPMWVNDPNGEEAKRIGRKAKTRTTLDGRIQTLIFRKASNKGERKTIIRKGETVNVPRSYPGAPGRISVRSNSGRIGSGNNGVRWRHPGIAGRQYMNDAIQDTSEEYGVEANEVYLVDAATYPTATKA